MGKKRLSKSDRIEALPDSILIPSRQQTQNAPTRPALTTLDVALAMAIEILHCHHLGIEQIPLIMGHTIISKKTTQTAEQILTLAEKLRKLIETYLRQIGRQKGDVSHFKRL